MKVQLFVPPGGYFAERWSRGSTMPPLGLLYIAAVLEREGIEVKIVPADVLKLDWKGVEKEILDYRPDIVGTTSTTENRFQSFELVKRAKKVFPQAVTIMGGPHASMAAEDSIAHIPELDVVVRGEGEVTMVELCRTLERKKDMGLLKSIPGLVFRDNGRIISTPPRFPIPDLDFLPFPAFHLVPFEKYNFRIEVPGHGKLPAVNIMTSRGCPFNCNFCATPINWGRTVRMRSPLNVIQEIEKHMERYGSKVIFFYDDTFNVSAKRVEEICDLILERKLGIFWRAEFRLDLLSKPLLEKMRKAGLFHMSFGIEAGSERIRNEIIHKKIKIEDLHNVIRWSKETGIIPNVFFIFSHPTETWEEAEETIRLIEQYREEVEATVAILHVYPGTPLESIAKKTGVLPEDFSWARKFPRQVITLPAAQGDVPLFIDRLSWAQISELLFRWSESGGQISLWRKIPLVFKHLRTVDDAKRYAIMAWSFLKLKLTKFFKKKKNTLIARDKEQKNNILKRSSR